MKSLSLDCAESAPPVTNSMRNQFKSKPIKQAHGFATSGETSDWERSISPVPAPSPRRLPVLPAQATQQTAKQPQPRSGEFIMSSHNGHKHFISGQGTHIVTHEYTPPDGSFSLYIGDRLSIVENGDPHWLCGYRTNDHQQQLLTFPSTCVAEMQIHEQPMKITQNVHIPESKIRFYRDQVIFVQPDSLKDNRVLVRNIHGAMAYCPVNYLLLLWTNVKPGIPIKKRTIWTTFIGFTNKHRSIKPNAECIVTMYSPSIWIIRHNYCKNHHNILFKYVYI